MTLRPEYSLGHSPYNPFLFASVGLAQAGTADGDTSGGDTNAGDTNSGDMGGGEIVTVLSALTRLKVDPWAEAARLASLPSDVAATVLAAMLAPLPAVAWEQGDVAGTARRLVTLLPAGGLADVPPMPGARAPSFEPAAGQVPYKSAQPRSWLGWTILFVVMLALAFYLTPDNNLEPSQPYGFTVQQ